jgi:putative membrane protein
VLLRELAVPATRTETLINFGRSPWLDRGMTEPSRQGEPPPTSTPAGADVDQRTSMAAERTWLAWWRTALAATAGALGVGRLAPELLDVASWPYVVLGTGYGCIAVGLLVSGALRQRDLQRALERGSPAPLSFQLVAVYTGCGVLLALTTIILVVAQT